MKGGSIVSVSVTMRPFLTAALGFGVSIYLNAVQALKLVETDNFESYGFDAAPAEADGGGDGEAADWSNAYDNAGSED